MRRNKVTETLTQPQEQYTAPVQQAAPQPVAAAPAEEKLLKRKLKTRDIGYFLRIINKVNNEGGERVKASGRDLQEQLQMNQFVLFAEAWDVAEKEMRIWLADLTGIPQQDERLEDLDMIARVIEEAQDDGGLERFLTQISRVQNRSAQTSTPSSSTGSNAGTDGQTTQ
jgi:hypothetical protein